ncbi:MAG: PrsW family intramembrane metalloprotease [Planctomycetes bacterium]|nr:PrsW family intramembrane metalloprotease [Planctomycetota bacterium]
MSDSDHQHGIEGEPQHNPHAFKPDPSEQKVPPPSRPHEYSEKTYRSGQSVYDEPDILPGRSREPVHRDWSCTHCGANLRGMPLETPCRECGRRNWYGPPPAGVDSYESWLKRLAGDAAPGRGTVVALACALIGGLFAVVSSLMGTSPGGIMSVNMPMLAIVFGPVVEETMKVAAASYVVEERPYLFTRRSQVMLSAVGAALMFAVLENLLYLFVYSKNPSTNLMLWRWTVCVALHVGCTAIVASGLADVWQRAMHEYRRPRISDLFPSLLTGIAIHGAYNAAVIGLEWKYPSFFR